jgi:general secretion pathway protein I
MRFASIGSPVASLWNACRSGGRARHQANAPPATARPASRGFTLIEALAAIVILALALSALLSAHDSGLRGATTIDDHLKARLLAQSLLAQFSVQRVPQSPARGRNGRFTWTVAFTPYAGTGATLPQATGDWKLHELTVTVAWPLRRQVELRTLRLMSIR